MRVIPLVCLSAAFCFEVLAAQRPRDDWKPGSTSEVGANLIYSLGNAPLTTREREQIYRLLDNQVVHDSFTNGQREEERDTVMGARVGFIGLADDGRLQVLVEGPQLFCGANGNCSYWIFTRQHDQLHLVLDAAGSFHVKTTSTRGFHDVVTSWHMSAYEGVFTVYRWNGTKYGRTDCYSVKYDRDYPVETPIIEGCHEGP